MQIPSSFPLSFTLEVVSAPFFGPFYVNSRDPIYIAVRAGLQVGKVTLVLGNFF